MWKAENQRKQNVTNFLMKTECCNLFNAYQKPLSSSGLRDNYLITLKLTIMKTYSYMGKQCAIHIPAENKKEAVKKLQEQGEAANMKNVYLLHKGVY